MTAGADEDRFARLHDLIVDLLKELEREYARARHEALRDPLTGLPNRRAFEPRLEQEVSRARRYGRRLTLIMFDIDHFKDYNDRHGHRSGDELLKRLGRMLTRELREPDLAFRIGGEEFVIVLPETNLDGALAVVCRLQERLRGDDRIPVTLSFGVAEFPTHALDAEPLVEAADRALYQAKAAGRDTVRLPDGSVPGAPEPGGAPAGGAGQGSSGQAANGQGGNGTHASPWAAVPPPPVRPVEVGFHVDEDLPASIWLNGRLLRVRQVVVVPAVGGPEEPERVFHVSTDDGDYRLFRRAGRWYLEGKA